MTSSRREFVTAAFAALALGHAPVAGAAQKASAFSGQTVIDLAKRLSAAAYVPPLRELPPRLAALSYDAYRRIQFRHPKALWATDDLGFRLEMFHRGGIFHERIELYEVVDGTARSLSYAPEQFLYDPPLETPLPADTGFAGFRLISQNGIDLDEIASFVGASYFRSLGRGQQYGLSARGLAIATGNPGGEEFPLFRAYWIERPQKGQTWVRVHALLDSPSVAGAYTFKIIPGATTLFEVEATLFPRREISDIGIAPLTSMYLFGPLNPGRFNDFRAAVHDSDGFEMITGANERLWRPLNNPQSLAESAFADTRPVGFGLTQRATKLEDYHDLEARYDRRPSAWVSPVGDWGEGAAHLFEIPSNEEGFDNIVAFWRPKAALAPHQGHTYRYSIAWGTPPEASPARGRVLQTRMGRASATESLLVVDFSVPTDNIARLTPVVGSSAGKLSPVQLHALPASGAVRATFYFTPGTLQSADLRLVLEQDAKPVTETWIFRWTS